MGEVVEREKKKFFRVSPFEDPEHLMIASLLQEVWLADARLVLISTEFEEILACSLVYFLPFPSSFSLTFVLAW